MNTNLLLEQDGETLRFAAAELKDYLRKICPELTVAMAEHRQELQQGNTVNRHKQTQDTEQTQNTKQTQDTALTDLPQEAFIQEQPQQRNIRLQLCPELADGDGLNASLDDRCQIQIRDLDGYIQGSNPRAVLIGVYQYLYRLGCRFLRPGKEYELLPSLSRPQDFDAQLEVIPCQRHRGVCMEGANSEKNNLNMIDWLPKIGCNSFFVQFQTPYPFLNRWYQHVNNPVYAGTKASLEAKPGKAEAFTMNRQDQAEAFTMEMAEKISARMDKAIRQRGLLHHRVGHGWTSRVMGQSDLGWASSEKKIGEAFREFPAMVNGRRELHLGIPGNTNLCYSNPEVVRQFTECVADYAQIHQDIQYLHVWLADDYNNQCECESCSKMIPADWYLKLLNSIDRELTRRGLNTRIVMLLYMDLLWPPREMQLENPERFLLMFAPISRTFNHSYRERGRLTPPPAYRRNHISLPSGLEENISFLREWQKQFAGDSFAYDYHLGRAHYGDLGYVSISRIFYEDIRTLKDLGLNGMICCQELRAFLPNALPDYCMARALLDEKISFEEITEDYFRQAYGEEWENCLKYLTKLSELSNCDYFNKKGDRKNKDIAEQMSKALAMLKLAGGWIEAQEQASKGVRKSFWKHLSYHRDYCSRLARALCELATGSAKTEEAWEEFKRLIRDKEAEFQECLDVYRVIEVGTNYTGFPKENG